MVCKFCGAINEDGSKFCGSCGNVIETIEPAFQSVQGNGYQPTVEQQNYQYQQAFEQQNNRYQQDVNLYQNQNFQPVTKTQNDSNKAKKKSIIIVAVVAAVLAVIAVVMIIVLFALDGTSKKPATETVATVEQAITEADAKKAVDTLLNDYGNSAFSFVYCKSLEDIKSNKLNYLCDDLGTFYSWTGFTGTLTNGTLKANALMTQAEYDKIIASGVSTWSVFKADDVQAKLDGIFGKGKYKVQDLVTSSSMITSSGYLIYDEEPVDALNVNYFGKVASCTKNGDDFVVEVNILRCNNTQERVYDEATEIELSMGTVDPGQGVNFDSIVSGLQINKSLMGNVTFTYGVSGETLVLKSVTKPEPVQAGSVSKVTTQAAPQISGEVISISSYGRYVKAGGGLNLRSLPSTYAARVTNIPNGSYVTVTGKSPYYSDWVYVSYGSYYGWVNANYLVTYQPSTYTNNSYGVVRAGGGLNMRSSPSTGASKVGNIPNGTSVYIYYYDSSYSWAYVYYGGTYGWVSADYLY